MIHDELLSERGILERNNVQVRPEGGSGKPMLVYDWTVLDALCAFDLDPDEKCTLATALCNLGPPELLRYPQFVLEIGERDFYRTRVLDPQNELSERMCKFRDNMLKVVCALIKAFHQVQGLDLPTLVNLHIARSIKEQIGDPDLASLEALLNPTSEDAQHLADFSESAMHLADQINYFVKNFRGSARTYYASLYIDNGTTWKRLDPKTHGIASTGHMSRHDASEIQAGGSRIRARAKLYTMLDAAVGWLRKDSAAMQAAKRFVADPQCGLNATMRSQLAHLHVERMCLLQAYALLYLDMTQWVASVDAPPDTGDRRTQAAELDRELDQMKRLPTRIWDRFEKVHLEAQTESVTITEPLGSAKKRWDEAVAERDRLVRLLFCDDRLEPLLWNASA